MKDDHKTKEQLLNETGDLRKKNIALENKKKSLKIEIEKIIKSEEKYRNLYERAPYPSALFNLKGIITSCNDSWLQLTGYSRKDIIGKHFSEQQFFNNQNFPEYFKTYNILSNGKEVNPFITDVINKKCEKIYLRVYLYRIKEKGKTVSFQIIAANVTDLIKAEKSLRKSQLEFSGIFKSFPEALVYVDEKANIIEINRRFTELFGYTLKEIKGRNIDDGMIHTSEMLKKGKELTRKGLEKGFYYETTRKKKNGTLFPVSISGVPVIIDGKKSGILGVYTDITKRQEMFQRFKESEDRYRRLFEDMPGVYYRTDREGNLIMINPAGVKLFGYENVHEMLGKNVACNFYYYPEKRKLYMEKMKKNKGVLKGTELVLKKKNGEAVFVSDTSHYHYDKEGDIAGIEGNFIDITARKKNEQIQTALYNISKAANSSISLEQLYPIIHKELGTIIDTTNFYIALLNHKKDKIYFPFHVDEIDDDFKTQSINDKSLTSYLIHHKKSLLLNYEGIQKLCSQGELSSTGAVTKDIFWFGVPLKVEERVIGAMAVQSYRNPTLYSEKDTTLLEFVSSQVATAIDRKQTEEMIKHLSFHDSLTDLYNRAYFLEELKRLNFPRYFPLSIVSIDINGLKFVNDTFGHGEGDKLLKHLAAILKKISRKGDILARVGGDEFAVVLPATSFSHTREFCERIKKVCTNNNIKPAYLMPSISLGYATQNGNYKDIDSLIKVSDDRMYQDKLFTVKNREKHLLDSILVLLQERDPHTRNHAQRLENLAVSLGREICLSEFELNNLKLLALLHDIGKIAIPDNILFKTCILTSSEWEKMKQHSEIGYRMARNFPDFAPIAKEILYHHEKWDGSGYPEGLKGEKIPLLSRIISIVDAYDVMQFYRPHKGALNKTKALKELEKYAGSQFDPNLVKVFIKLVKGENLKKKIQ